MTTIQIQPDTKVAVDDVLNGVARLNTPELEDFFYKVAQVLAARKAPHLSKLESELLQKINAGYPDVVSKRFEQLLTKKEQQVLTPLEQQELIDITDHLEVFDAKRLEALLELATLRDVSLDELLKHMTQPSASH
jgi:hypothetical protein